MDACWLSERDAQLARARRLAATDVPGALGVIAAVLAEAPDDFESLRAQADVLSEAGEETASRRCLERMLTLDPEDGRALIDLADLERDLERALALYDRAIAVLQDRGARGGAGGDLDAARRGRAATLAAMAESSQPRASSRSTEEEHG